MAVQLNNVPSKFPASAQSLPSKGIMASLRSLSQPRCPDCGKRGMVCRYVVPADYNEPSPRYFECECCAARYFRMTTGPWFSAQGPQFAQCYEVRTSQVA